MPHYAQVTSVTIRPFDPADYERIAAIALAIDPNNRAALDSKADLGFKLAMEKTQDRVNIFNLGTDEYCEVNDSIGWICGKLGVKPERQYTGGERGWIGDSPFIFLDTQKVRALGWKPTG